MTIPPRKPANAALIVAICWFVAALEGYDIQAFGVAAPRFAPELHLNPSQLGWAGSAAMFGLVIGATFGGWVADRIGRKPVLAVCTAIFGIFSVATALVHDSQMLVLARLLTGFGFGGALPNLAAIATEISAPERRAATTTTIFCGMPAGGAVVALAAKLGGEGLDWRLIFEVGGLLPLILTPVIWLMLPETRPDHEPHHERSTVRALFGEGRALPTALTWIVFIITLIVLYLMLNWLPTLVIAKGFSKEMGSNAALIFNLASVVGALLMGWVVDRSGFRWPLLSLFGALALTLWGMAGVMDITLLLVLSGAAGFLVIGANYALYALAPILYAPQTRAAGAGAAMAVGRIGSIIGPLLAGELRNAGFSPGQVFGVLAPMVLAAAVAVLALTTVGRTYAGDRL
jgi:AAHS family 3-hydroxyphenylpropionic acid transporter